VERRDAILLPPGARVEGPLPRWVAVVAMLGLAIVIGSVVPAVLRRVRLTRDLDRLQAQVAAQEREVLRLEREVRAARSDTFAYEQALRSLFHPAGPPTRPTGPRRADRRGSP
jgi:hypothetical protein